MANKFFCQSFGPSLNRGSVVTLKYTNCLEKFKILYSVVLLKEVVKINNIDKLDSEARF